MEQSDIERAVEAASSLAATLGLPVTDAVIVHNSNRVVVRLTPCDVLARIRPLVDQSGDQLEVEITRRLAETGSPVAELAPRVEPRVYIHDGFAVTLWKYHEPVGSSDIAPAEYADALVRLHAGLRKFDVSAPHFTDQIAGAQGLVANREQTPELPDSDRELLDETLRRLSTGISGLGSDDQLPNGRYWRIEGLNQIRAALNGREPDVLGDHS
jgi:hypothetical protein